MNWADWMMVGWFILVIFCLTIIIVDKNKNTKGDTQMTKICDWENCNEEVADWQTHCPKHYAMMQQQKTQSGMVKPEQPAPATHQQPVQPAPKQQQPAPVQEEMIDLEEPETQPVQPVQQPEPEEFIDAGDIEEPENAETLNFPDLPKLSDRERLIVKQTAFKGAIELMSKMEFEAKQFEDLIGEIETLTLSFYRLIVVENER